MNPAISIIIPSFNEEKYISRCLDSVLNQTFTDFEVLCVDDGSTDNTFNIIKEYSAKDSRIIPLKNPGKGVSSARNFGIDNANGDYIGFVDSDDFIQPQMYEFLYRAVTENDCDFSVCNYKKTSDIKEELFEYKCENFSIEKFFNLNKNEFEEKYYLIFFTIWTKLISKSFLNDIRFQNFRIGEDTVFCIELYAKKYKAAFVDITLYNYFLNSNSVTSVDRYNEKWFDSIIAHFICYNLLKENNEIFSSFYLERSMKCLLSFRFNIKNTPNEKKFKKPLNDYFKKYIMPFLKCKDISLKNRIIIPIFFLVPPLYSAFRKIMEKIS